MNNSIIRWVVIFGAIVVVGIIGIQAYWVMATWDLNEDEFDRKTNYALYQVANTLAALNDSELPSRDIVNQRSSNYWVVNMEVEIEDQILEHLLQKEFEKQKLNVDFEYAVFDCSSNEMVYGGYCTYTPEGEKHDVELGDLPAAKEFTYYFGVKFPTRQGFLFDKMQLISFLSVILLLTILFFAYALWVILRQKRLSEMQKDFINNMTHEFKTPLSTIKIAAGVFLNDDYIKRDNRLSRYASIIVEQNQRLDRQVEKVLQIASIEKGNLELKKEKFLLADVLEPLLESTNLRVEELGGKLTTQLPHLSTLFIKADRLHLSNILYSLLDNAIKYCVKKPLIEVNVKQKGKSLMIEIKDNGIGIDPAHKSRIFDKFYRVPTGNIHNVKGFGLGLYYVKKICEAHKWELRLDSELNVGTCVHITLK